MSSDADFEGFYRAEFLPLVRHVMWCGASQADAADAVQFAFGQAFSTWDTLRNPGAWLRTVARRAFYRSPAVDRREVLAADPYESGQGETSYEQLSVAAEYDQMLSAVRALPSRQREVMALSIDGWRAVDIASQLGVEPGAVRENLRKARRNLKQALNMPSGSRDR